MNPSTDKLCSWIAEAPYHRSADLRVDNYKWSCSLRDDRLGVRGVGHCYAAIVSGHNIDGVIDLALEKAKEAHARSGL